MSIKNDARLDVERFIVEKVIDRALAEGWLLHSVYDGEDYIDADTKAEALDAIFAVDEATVRFTKNECRLRGIFIVLGNGSDVLCDWSYPDKDPEDWNGMMDRTSEWLSAVGEVFGA